MKKKIMYFYRKTKGRPKQMGKYQVHGWDDSPF